MKITVTKSEYEVVKTLGFTITQELAKAGDITGVSQEDIYTYEETFDGQFENEKGKWGKCVVRKDTAIGNNKIIIDINEECISDIINELYNPVVIATIKCIVNVIKTFTGVFKKCEKSFENIYDKWFSDEN